MKSATQALEQKGTNAWSVHGGSTISNVLERLRENKNLVPKIVLTLCFTVTGLLYLVSITLLAATIFSAMTSW